MVWDMMGGMLSVSGYRVGMWRLDIEPLVIGVSRFLGLPQRLELLV